MKFKKVAVNYTIISAPSTLTPAVVDYMLKDWLSNGVIHDPRELSEGKLVGGTLIFYPLFVTVLFKMSRYIIPLSVRLEFNPNMLKHSAKASTNLSTSNTQNSETKKQNLVGEQKSSESISVPNTMENNCHGK